MRRTEQILCISFVLNFLVTSVHYRAAIWASSPRNHIPGHCRRLQVPCVMRPVGQHSIIQAVGFRCAHCSSEFETRHAMDCHRRKQSSQGTECADPRRAPSRGRARLGGASSRRGGERSRRARADAMFLARRREIAVGGRDGAPGEEDQRGRRVDLPTRAVGGRGARTTRLATRRHGSEVGDGGQARNFHGKREGQRTAPKTQFYSYNRHNRNNTKILDIRHIIVI